MSKYSIQTHIAPPIPNPPNTYTVTMNLTHDQLDQFQCIIGSVSGNSNDVTIRELLTPLYLQIGKIIGDGTLPYSYGRWYARGESIRPERS